MATCAVLGRGLVQQHLSPVHFCCLLVAFQTSHPRVRPSQGEARALVIETRRPPPIRVMADVATGGSGCSRELSSVNVLVAARASQRRVPKYDLGDPRRKRSRAVALTAEEGPVSAGESKTGGRVVELRNLPPSLYSMAGLALEPRAGTGGAVRGVPPLVRVRDDRRCKTNRRSGRLQRGAPAASCGNRRRPPPGGNPAAGSGSGCGVPA